MSAPHVKIDKGEAPVYWWTCALCGVAGRPSISRADVDLGRIEHEAQHAAHIRLQAIWDARNEALRALIEKWREESGRLSGGRMAIGYAAGRTDAADELERAIGGGRC